MVFVYEFLAVAIIHFLAVVSPGPDFAMISRSSLVYSRRTGLLCALGLALGILVHVTYSLVGIGFIIARSLVLYSTIKYLGAGYLLYIGWKSLRAKRPLLGSEVVLEIDRDLPALTALRTGFLTNALNPKVTLFFLGLFTQVIRTTTPLWIQMLYGVEMSLMTFLWFAFVALVLSHRCVRGRFLTVQHIVERCCGVLLIALGLRVAFDRR